MFESSVTPWTVARQAPLPMGLSRQEYWNGLPFPSPGNLLKDWTHVYCISCIGRQTTSWAIGEGNGNPLQCSCLENPRDGGAWWAAVYGVAQSRTQLKRLSSSSSIKNNKTFLTSKVKRQNSYHHIKYSLILLDPVLMNLKSQVY